MKKKVNALTLLSILLCISIGIAAIITDWKSNGVWIFLGMVFWSAVIFVVLFILSAVVIGALNIPLKEPIEIHQDNEDVDDNDIFIEEDEDEKKARKKAMRRIKKLQRDFPESWELLVEPDDEYLCFDYLYEKKKEKEKEESAGFAAVLTTLNAHNAGNGNSS